MPLSSFSLPQQEKLNKRKLKSKYNCSKKKKEDPKIKLKNTLNSFVMGSKCSISVLSKGGLQTLKIAFLSDIVDGFDSVKVKTVLKRCSYQLKVHCHLYITHRFLKRDIQVLVKKIKEDEAITMLWTPILDIKKLIVFFFSKISALVNIQQALINLGLYLKIGR